LARERADKIADAISSETFSYDPLNRLTEASVTVGAPVNVETSSFYGYDPNGNLVQKDGKTYNYGDCQGSGRSGSGLHQVCSIDGGPTFVYDAAGNLTGYSGTSLTYNAHNMVEQIISAAGTTQFMYGADESRVVQLVTSNGTPSRTVYVGLAGTGKSMYERTTTGPTGQQTVQHTNFIYAGNAHGGNAFAVRLVANSTTTTRYMTFDHLGSTTSVSDERGHIAAATGTDTELLGYDAWGARRNPDGQAAASGSTFPSSAGHRDFTGQETIPGAGLINMNGRVYDPSLARFLSPDPNVREAANLQNFNRYSYVLNNPLRYTDPTGYDCWGSVEGYFSNPLNDWYLLTTIAGIGACVALPGAGCLLVGADLALMNAEAAVAFGASFEQTAINLAIGFSVGLVTSGALGAALGPGANPIWGIVAGAASAAASTAISDVVAGRSLGWDVFWSAAISAAEGAATLGLQKAVALSQSSGTEEGGSGEAAVEAHARRPPGTMVASNGDDLSFMGAGSDDDPSGTTGVAHLVARPIDTSSLPWYQRLIIALTGGSHAAWIVETDDGVALIQSGPSGPAGAMNVASDTNFATYDQALTAFGKSDNGNSMPVTELGRWAVTDVPDLSAIVNQWNSAKVPYVYNQINSNTFAHWFAYQAGFPMPVVPPGPAPWNYWLYGWDHGSADQKK
jgi:RHS repeat-associated protein